MKSLGTHSFKYSGSKLSPGQAKRKQKPRTEYIIYLSNFAVCIKQKAKFSGFKSLSVYSKVRQVIAFTKKFSNLYFVTEQMHINCILLAQFASSFVFSVIKCDFGIRMHTFHRLQMIETSSSAGISSSCRDRHQGFYEFFYAV